MNATTHSVRIGLRRGLTEFRQSMTNREDVGWYVVTGLILLGVLLLQRGGKVEGTTLSLATLSLPGILGMQLVLGGVIGTGSALVIHREDGTLLRAKAVPHGMVGYLTGLVLGTSLGTIVSIVILLVPGLFLLDGLTETGVSGWLTLVWVFALGFLATLPWGAMMGSLFTNPQAAWGLGFLSLGGLVAISGIFYPIQALWGWVQGVAQIFPVYWLGLGMRSALLPESAAAVEIGESWRTPEMIGVLGAWAIVGFVLAPVVLRRMARLESGGAVEARRQKAMQRV
jgi:ABC-2 type transport system permease protein